MLNNISIKTKLLSSFFMLVVIIIVISVFCYKTLNYLDDTISDLYHSNLLGSLSVENIESDLLTIRGSVYKLYIDSSEYDRLSKAINDNFSSINNNWTYYKSIPLLDEEKDLVKEFDTVIVDFKENTLLIMSLFKDEKAKEQIHDYFKSTSKYVQSRNKLANITEEIIKLRKEHSEVSDASADNTVLQSIQFLTTLSFISIILTIVTSVYLIRNINGSLAYACKIMDSMASGYLEQDLDKAYLERKDEFGLLIRSAAATIETLTSITDSIIELAVRINQTSVEIANSGQDLSEMTSEQAVALEETAASLEEITTTVSQNTDNTNKAFKLTSDTKDKSKQSLNLVRTLEEAIKDIRNNNDKILTVISVIDELSSKTNMLSLNAAVEAARAGIHGRGFSVLSDEIRNLSLQTSSYSKEIHKVIDDCSYSIDNGTLIAETAITSLTEIQKSIEQSDLLLNDIAVSSREQACGIEQISSAVVQIDKATQKNTQLADKTLNTSLELTTMGEDLNSLLEFFKKINS